MGIKLLLVMPSLAAVGTRVAQTTFSSRHQGIPILKGQENVEIGSHVWSQMAMPVPVSSAEGLPSDPGPTFSSLCDLRQSPSLSELQPSRLQDKKRHRACLTGC